MKQNNYKKMFYAVSEVDKAHTWTFSCKMINHKKNSY